MNTLKINSNSPHICSVLTGFLMLKEQNVLDFDINFCYSEGYRYPHSSIVEAEIDGVRIAFDLHDGYMKDLKDTNSFLDKVDYYFKRSSSSEKNMAFSEHNREKIFPLGLSYYVTCKGNPIGVPSFSIIKSLKKSYKKLLGDKDNHFFTVERFEEKPDYKESDLRIIFMTRLWQPVVSNDQKMAHLNQIRIDIIREMRKEYGDYFYGGLLKSDFAKKLCPELVIPYKMTLRPNYLTMMKQSDICIGSVGLHDSIGWKTGEYVAASRAIVNERFRYEVPGDFTVGKNYFDFDTVDECMMHVDYLYNNPDAVYQMKCSNEEYYKNYLRPDRQVYNALATALPHFQSSYTFKDKL